MVRQVIPETINLFGGTLCLDFANTIDWHDDGTPLGSDTDALFEPAALAHWGRRLGLLDDGVLVTGEELAAARDLRASLHATFSAIADGRTPPAAALARLAHHHAEAAATGRLTTAGGASWAPDGAWRLDWPAGDARRVRFAAVSDALALLRDPERLARVRVCPGHLCGWLFYDSSGRRRWCSMQVCGSREKMRRLYARRRG